MIILGLGSNLGDREANILEAIALLNSHPEITVVRQSSIYETEPIGVKDQPFFLNAAVIISTGLPPEQLLNICLAIEGKMGRIREMRWGPRIIDIDILIYKNLESETEKLSLPHPRLHERRFVLVPLCEILGENDLLIGGRTVGQLLSGLNDTSVVKVYKNINEYNHLLMGKN